MMLRIEEPRSPHAGHLPLLRLGFRPFYLLAALFAVLAIPLWLASYLGVLKLVQVDLLWHMHEMVFGMGAAVVVGFLFTAARNWTGLWTPRGPALGLFALGWIGARAAMLLAPASVAALLDLPFLPAAALALYRLMRRSGQQRNLPLVAILALMAAANLAFHLARMGAIALAPDRPVQAALLLIVLLLTVMGGRVLPGFTANGAMVRTVSRPRLDQAGTVLVAATLLAWLVQAPGVFTAAIGVLAALVHLARLQGWRPLRTLAYPLLWILHLAYGWIGVGLLLLAAAALGWSAPSSAFHALGVGAMASMIVGMLVRTTRGHTGQILVATSADQVMFVCIQAGAVARLCANLHADRWRAALLVCSGLLWSASFLLYSLKYAPALMRPRQDGREG